MWLLLVVPVVVVAVLSVVGLLRAAPSITGVDPDGLRTIVVWRDPAAIAAEVAGEPQEQLRQLVGALAEGGSIVSSSIDRRDPNGPVAHVDVRQHRLELRARTWRGGQWILWIDERGRPPRDSDDLRQLLTGLYRTLEARGAESARWHRREEMSRADRGAPSPFYVG